MATNWGNASKTYASIPQDSAIDSLLMRFCSTTFLLIRKIRILKIEKFAVELYDLNRFFASFCEFLRIFPKNQFRHRQKTVDDSEYVPLSYDILCKRFPF